MLKATVIGNIGGDPDMRYSANGSPFLRFNVASNYRTRTPEGEWQERTEWIRVTVFGQRAESLAQYLRKGTRVYVDGRLEARPWTSQQGEVRAGLEITATDVVHMSSRSDDESRGGGEAMGHEPRGSGESMGRESSPPRSGGQASRPSAPSRSEPADDGDLEDLPF